MTFVLPMKIEGYKLYDISYKMKAETKLHEQVVGRLVGVSKPGTNIKTPQN